MDPRLARFERLLLALEQLSSTTSLQLGLGNAQTAGECLSRSEAILSDLAPLSDELRRDGLLPQPLLTRARSLLETHERIRGLITKNLSSLRTQLDESSASTSRLRKITPAYGAYKKPRMPGVNGKLESTG